MAHAGRRAGFVVGAVVVGAVMVAGLLAGCTSNSSSAAASGPASAAVPAASSVPMASSGSAPTVTTPSSPAGDVSSGKPTAGDPATGNTATSKPATSKKSSTTTSTTTATVTRTLGGATITVDPTKPPAATQEPAPVDGDCPYLSADVVSDITGQHHGQTQLINVAPHPICVFYRSDGGLMGSVRVISASSAAAAIAAVNQHVPVGGSQPVTQPAGWVGGSMTSAGQMTQDSVAKSVYAVSKGKIAIVAEENESPSIKARVMAVCAIYGLGLESGAKPDYCSVSG